MGYDRYGTVNGRSGIEWLWNVGFHSSVRYLMYGESSNMPKKDSIDIDRYMSPC